MYTDKKNRISIKILVFILAVILAAGLAAYVINTQSSDLMEEGEAAIKNAIQRSALQCYAVEGIYPPNLDYLKDHYGLSVNERDYYIKYDAFASNMPPEVRVAAK